MASGAAGGKAEAIPADLTAAADVETVIARAQAALGPVDILVNNVGVNFYGTALDVRASRYQVMFDMMVRAPFRLCQLAVPGMVGRFLTARERCRDGAAGARGGRRSPPRTARNARS